MTARKRARSGGSKGHGKSPSGKGQAGKGRSGNRSVGGGAKGPQATNRPARPPTASVTAPVANPVTAPDKASVPPAAPAAASAPSSRSLKAPNRGGPRVTKVVVRHIDPRSALRVSVVFYASLSIALLVAAGLLWGGANAVGLVGNIEAFMDEVGFTDFQLRTGQFLKASVLTAIVFTVAGSVANLLMAVLYNLISETIGGINVVLGDDRPDPKP